MILSWNISKAQLKKRGTMIDCNVYFLLSVGLFLILMVVCGHFKPHYYTPNTEDDLGRLRIIGITGIISVLISLYMLIFCI